jgi:glutathione S-transferase
MALCPGRAVWRARHDDQRVPEFREFRMILYASAAPTPRRVRMFMAEKGIAIPTVNVDLGKGEQFSTWYRAINPGCTVPALVLDDGTAISEVPAIWHLLDALYPDPPLMGVTGEERALILMWERRMEFDGYFAAAEAFRNSLPAFAGRALVGPHGYEQIAALADRGRARTLNFYAALNDRLTNASFVAGDAFTVADITALVSVDFAKDEVGVPVPAAHDALSRWHAAIAERPSFSA